MLKLTLAQKKGGQALQLLQRQLQFPLIDELVNNYIVLERFYIKNSLFLALESDNREYVKTVQKSYTQEKFDQNQVRRASYSLSQEILDLIDDFCFILDTCSRRVSLIPRTRRRSSRSA